MPGLQLPTWADVRVRAAEYEAWDRPRIVVDTAGRGAEACLAEPLAHLPTCDATIGASVYTER